MKPVSQKAMSKEAPKQRRSERKSKKRSAPRSVAAAGGTRKKARHETVDEVMGGASTSRSWEGLQAKEETR